MTVFRKDITKGERIEVPGVIIDRSPDFDRVYIGSPSIATIPDASYVASHDWFGPGTSNNRTAVFGSSNRGKTWRKLADLDGQWWSTLFAHHGVLYIIGTSNVYGNTVLRRSSDGGKTWTEPKDEKSGLLLGGGKYHCAPVPVIVHAGRIWRAMEDSRAGGGWPRHFRAFVMSARADTDLLQARNWSYSNRLHFDPAWFQAKRPGWLEGNMIVTPAGELLNVLRFNEDHGDRAAITYVSPDGKKLTFNPEQGVIAFPGGRSKFTIRYDAKTRRYWSLVNKQTGPPAYRNIVALTSSADVRDWKVESIILRHDEQKHHAWQYLDWLFEGDDIIVVSRTAWHGSHNAHDANYMTFHLIEDFRKRSGDSPTSGNSE